MIVMLYLNVYRDQNAVPEKLNGVNVAVDPS
jgi:hypothetical protein